MSRSWSIRCAPLDRFLAALRHTLATARWTTHDSFDGAPFTDDDVSTIRRFGEPAWLVEANADPRYFCPPGADGVYLVFRISLPADLTSGSSGLICRLVDWAIEVDVSKSTACARLNEHAFFHRASRTLDSGRSPFSCFRRRHTAGPASSRNSIMRLPRLIGISVLLPLPDSRQGRSSRVRCEDLLEWDFQQIVVAHGEPITVNARAVLVQALARAWPRHWNLEIRSRPCD